MVKCFAVNCGSDNTTSKINFFVAPQEEGIRSLWYQRLGWGKVIGRMNQSRVLVCEKHFDEEDWLKSSKTSRTRLKKSILPHRNLPNPKDNGAVKYDFLVGIPTKPIIDIPLPSAAAKARKMAKKEQKRIATLKVPKTVTIGTQTEEIIFPKLENSLLELEQECHGFTTKKIKTEHIEEVENVEIIHQDLVQVLKAEVPAEVNIDGTTENFLPFLQHQIQLMKSKSQVYFGVPPDKLRILLITIQKYSSLPEPDFYLTLRKIWLNDPFEVLADVFCISTTSIYASFNGAVPIIGDIFKSFIIWYLPKIQNPKNVDGVLDCIEFLNYKYLIVCNLDGEVTFISRGFPKAMNFDRIMKESKFIETWGTENIFLVSNCASQLKYINIVTENVHNFRVAVCAKTSIQRLKRKLQDLDTLPHIDQPLTNRATFIIAAVLVNSQFNDIQLRNKII